MASTSLRRQVDALRNASSGTSSGYIQRKKGRASLLLTPDQAADVDLSSVRETAVMGLQRLEAVDQDFSPFQDTLFSKEAEGTLRDLQTKESNERIDKSITSFLALLSPHFSSREAHFCLEYLIRHYKIYQYNVDAVVECCLPWHDTVAFARMVQLLSLKGSRWEFLTPVQKTGSPLPREAIARRCARDFGLLRFLCVSARRAAAAAAESSSRRGGGGATAVVSAATAAGRAKLFSFYAAVVVEALASLGTASEPLLRALVPTVVHGLSATRSPEYQMASYMILSALSGKGPLSRELTNAALTALVCKPCQGGMEPSLLCALAIAQTQVGFASKKDSPGPGPLLLPTPAFQRLSGVESLASVLARLAKEFDATAFLWLLLQSYVKHLPDEDGAEHCASLTRLCLYPHWPPHSLPRLIRRLVDRLLKTCLAVDEEGAAHGSDEDEGAREKVLRASRMKVETREVLRVLGQRFPHDVDAAVAKLSKYIARGKAESAAAAAADLVETGEDADSRAETARREARREEVLSSLLVSTFAGANLAARLPLQPEADTMTNGDESLKSTVASGSTGVHASLMVALEHPSGRVRARAVEQLSNAVGEGAGAVGGNDGSLRGRGQGGGDLTAAVLRRLYDEDPEVVLAVTGSDNLLHRVLLRHPYPDNDHTPAVDEEKENDVVVGGGSVSSRAAAVSSAAAIAATPWLSALSQARPAHPVAESGRVLGGLLRVAKASVAAIQADTEKRLPEELEEVEKTREAATRLLLECLPGPHANARVRLLRRACADVRVSGGGTSEADDAADAAAGRACKKAVRNVARAAVEMVAGLEESSDGRCCLRVFEGVGKALRGVGVPKSSKKKGSSKRKEADGMEVDGVISKGLKEMGEEVCDALAAGFSAGDKTRQLQVLGENSDAGARWFLLECISRAVPLSATTNNTSSEEEASTSARLASLLARLATFELRLRPDAFAEPSSSGSGTTATAVALSPTDLLRCLQVCAANLPRPERPSSLFSEDHVTVASSGERGAEIASPLLLGDVLVSVLKATSAAAEGEDNRSSAWEVVGAVVFHGYGRRPLSALAAVAIAGISASRGASGGEGDADGERVVSSTRALCVAAAFVKAEAVATEAGGGECGEELRDAERDLVAVFPAAMLAVTSEEKSLREAGLLFMSTVAAHGSALCAVYNGGKKDTNQKRASNKDGSNTTSEAEDSEFFPLLELAGGDAALPSPLCPPALESVVELARALEERNGESGLGGGELPRHLAALLGGGDAPTDSESPSLSSSSALSLSRYLVAWAASLGWRNPSASARLLECLAWAKAPLTECCLPLLRHCLDSEGVRDNADSARLLKVLLSVAITSPSPLLGDGTSSAAAEMRSPLKSPGKARGKGKDKGTPAKTTPISKTPTLVFQCNAAEVLVHRCLRTSGQIRTFTLQALGSLRSSSASVFEVTGGVDGGEKESTRQRTKLLSTLVDVGLLGADAGLIAAAASALDVTPEDVVVLVGELVPSEKSGNAKKRKQTTSSTAWVSKLGGVVELAQALCSSDRSSERSSRHRRKGHASSTNGAHGNLVAETSWSGSAPLGLARPLFDALPPLLSATQSFSPSVSSNPPSGELGGTPSEGDVAAVEYALWLTMDVLGAVLRRQRSAGVVGGKGLYNGDRAGEDAERVLCCVRENPSPQTRISGLALLSRMATLFPAAMASRLRSLLGAVCASATTGEGVGGRAVLRQTQKAVQSVVPALRAHGAEVGVGAHLVAQVFVDALGEAPVHARRLLFGTLVDSLGDDSLAIISALLLRQAVTLENGGKGQRGRGGKKKRTSEKDEGEDASSTLIEFAHQTVHSSGGQAQVRALVGLVQACRRLSVFTAEKSGCLTGIALEDALEQLSSAYNGGGKAPENEADYLTLNLDQTEAEEETGGDTANASPDSKSAFMTMDLRSLAELSEAEVVKSGGGDQAVAIVRGIFLENVLAFVRDHLVSKPLLMTVAASAERDEEAGGDGVQEGFLLLCEELLLLLRTLAACENGPDSSDNGASWPTLQGLGYSVFETLQSLLSVPSFVAVTQELLRHQDPHLRRKALQMFTRRLDPASGGTAPSLSPGEEYLFVEMVPSLRMVAMGKSTRGAEETSESDPDPNANLEEVMGPSSNEEAEEGEESAVNRQTALLSLDVLARVLGRRHKDAFVGVVEDVTEIVAGTSPAALPGISEAGAEGILPLRASAFLLLATLCAVLGVRAFPHLPRFFPAMLRALEHLSKLSPGGGNLVDAVLSQENGGGRPSTGGGGLLWTSALSAVATVAASLPSFLSPYLGRILAVALRAANGRGAGGVLQRGDGGSVAPGGNGGRQAADRVLSLLASGVEPRLLVPAVCAAYSGCVKEGATGGEEMVVVTARKLARLLAYVQEILAGLEKEAASAALPQLSRLLTEALDFRRVHASGSAPEVRASADLVETEASSAMVSLVMRLSEVELRPLFLHLCEWKAAIATEDGSMGETLGGLDRRLSFYKVLNDLSASLKSIFTPYFAHVLTDCCDDMEAASLLATTTTDTSSSSSSSAKRKREAKDEARRKRRKKGNAARDDGATAMSEDEEDMDGAADVTTAVEVRWRRDAAARLVLSSLRSCFSSDRSGFVDKTRFEVVMPAVVSQLECGATFPVDASSCEEGADEVASCRRHAEELVGPCLSQLAAASGKDVLWKSLASAVLLRTRSKRAGVRVAALISLRQCFEVVGEEFLSLLPECLPFLSELLEDGHPEVETECRALVKYIEGVLGESIESYLV